ncbi:hypothetical protein CTEN210_14746 [Chaetoceros tenuissimus]|uniref:Uncharacterized protein n=1 Tax=Chaetoceros tenuissimus TaxID=426638 RepID=A0AAD3D856_9STRA|nr:hypothetical protein CTEN210_14746 [Chaetoceros tenuissimus]
MSSNTEETPLVCKPDKVVYTWETYVQNHTRFLAMLPGYFSAYIIPGRTIKPKDVETVMVTMNNSLSSCPYCTGLHGQLARMAGLSMDAEQDPSNPYVTFSKTFALNSGRGEEVEEALKTLGEKIESTAMAHSVYCLCWALQWGKTTGNSINNARDKIKRFEFSSVNLLDILLLLWYGPLFLIIGILNLILLKVPEVSPKVSAALGAILWFPQALFIAPMGFACFIASGFKVV